MSPPRTARARARAELTREIKDAARAQLALVGPAALSLRAVARDIGIVPSGLYRYFAGRDQLLTALIIDAYHAIADAAEAADATVATSEFAARWRSTAHGLRRWALQHPYEWALVYGSPVPGYRAPQDTIGPALRVFRALTAVFADAARAGRVRPAAFPGPPPTLLDNLAPSHDTLLVGAPADLAPVVIMAVTQVVGGITLELFGHFENGVLDTEAMFDFAVTSLATLAGLS